MASNKVQKGEEEAGTRQMPTVLIIISGNSYENKGSSTLLAYLDLEFVPSSGDSDLHFPVSISFHGKSTSTSNLPHSK